jgi:hypothetical protein
MVWDYTVFTLRLHDKNIPDSFHFTVQSMCSLHVYSSVYEKKQLETHICSLSRHLQGESQEFGGEVRLP